MAKTTRLEVSARTDFPDERGQFPDILTGDCIRPERIRENVVVVAVHVGKLRMKLFQSCLSLLFKFFSLV